MRFTDIGGKRMAHTDFLRIKTGAESGGSGSESTEERGDAENADSVPVARDRINRLYWHLWRPPPSKLTNALRRRFALKRKRVNCHFPPFFSDSHRPAFPSMLYRHSMRTNGTARLMRSQEIYRSSHLISLGPIFTQITINALPG
jgi:hypothetical protein